MTPLEQARAYANELTAMQPPAGHEALAAWSLLSIAESLDRIAGHGVETYENDIDGHRIYR